MLQYHQGAIPHPYLFGDERFLRESKETIFSKEPTDESVKYNLREGLQILDMASIAFDNFRYYLRKAFQKTSPDTKEFAKSVLNDEFHDIKFVSGYEDEDSKIAESYLLQTVRNSNFAIGYLLAADKMKVLGRTITLRDLREQNDNIAEKLFNELSSYHKHCQKTKGIIDPLLVEKYLAATIHVYRHRFGL